jgi:pimeloyl-ACP methyl ester carboxylesterase
MNQNIIYKNGHHLSYAEYGDKNGYPILIHHGLIASIDDHDLFESLIRSNLRLICVARPGYGDSSPYEMRDFAEWGEIISVLVEELSLAQFDVLGISSGAPYGYSVGNKFPDEVRNIFIFSGIPALYDEVVLSHWQYPPIKSRDIAEVEALAHQLFFCNLTMDDLKRNDIKDSMMNNCFGIAQDLMLRFKDWGFSLPDVKAKVFMRHSKTDNSVPFETAIRTAELLPNCELELLETGPHFSNEVLDDFIKQTIIQKVKE